MPNLWLGAELGRLLAVHFITGTLVLGGESGAIWVLDLSMVPLDLLRPASFIFF